MNQYRTDINEGMVVRSIDGERLGKVSRLDSDFFLIEKGIFFKEDFAARYDDVYEIRDGEIILSHEKSGLLNLSEQGGIASDTSQRVDVNNNRSGINFDASRFNTNRPSTEGATEADANELRVPVVEEELSVDRQVRDAGSVRVRKEINVDEKQISVPVRHEEVVVERVAAPPGTTATGGEEHLEEDEIVIPVQAEEVEISKRPVVKGEVRIRKETREEQENATASLRRAEVKVDDQIQKSGKGAPPQPPPTKTPRSR